MKERVISGLVIAALVVVFGLVGNSYPLAIVIMACSMIGYWELCRACGVTDSGPAGAAGTEKAGASGAAASKGSNSLIASGILLTAVYYAGLVLIQFFHSADARLMFHRADILTLAVMALGFIAMMSLYVLTFPRYDSNQVMAAYFSFIYAPVMLSFVYRARLLPYGVFVYILIFLCSSVCDVCALAAGMKFGKHKMAPVLSPKKTIEGAVGGVAGSVASCLLVSYAVQFTDAEAHLQIPFMIIGLIGALVSMLGDLAASAIKRNHQIKDYGSLIPGHGGIMDRFDSIIFTAPLIYFMGVLLLGIAA